MGVSSTIRRVTMRPPAWWRVASVVMVAPIVLGAASRRGWGVGIVAGVVYGGLTMGMALAPDQVRAWSQRHPLLDGAILGPLSFLAAAYFTSWSLWVCMLAGAAGVVAGVALVDRRQRRRAEDRLH